MPPYLYALLGAFIFAIAHGMHFTVAPLPGATSHISTLVERHDTAPERLVHRGVFSDIVYAGL